jgi:hypothetical protein
MLWRMLERTRPATARFAIVVATCLSGGCIKSQLELDGAMRLEGAVEIKGPIQMQLSGPSITYAGVYVSEALFDRIDEGSTTGEWVRAVIGEPMSTSQLRDGTEIWRWSYQPERESLAPITVWSSGGKEEPRVRQSLTFLQLRDGIVIEKWRD